MADRNNPNRGMHVLKEFVCEAILDESVAKLVADAKPSTKLRNRTVICEPIVTDAIPENPDDQHPKEQD